MPWRVSWPWRSSPLTPGSRTSSTMQAGSVGQGAAEQFGRRAEQARLEADGSEQAVERGADASVVINDDDD